MAKASLQLPNLGKPRPIRFTVEQWEFLVRRAIETGVREPQIFLRQLIDREIQAVKAGQN